jgi:hypothetical protein
MRLPKKYEIANLYIGQGYRQGLDNSSYGLNRQLIRRAASLLDRATDL